MEVKVGVKILTHFLDKKILAPYSYKRQQPLSQHLALFVLDCCKA